MGCREPWEAPDIFKGHDNHLDALSPCSNHGAISALPAQTAANTSSLLEAMTSIRFLPAALLPSGDKVVSTLATACWWVVKVSEGFQNTHTYTALLLSHNFSFIF